MERRNIVATIVVLVLFAIIGYVVLTRTNLLGRLRQPVSTSSPAPIDRDIDSGVNLDVSPTPFPLLFPTPSGSPVGSIRPFASASPVAQCANLTATPANGTAPLTVRLTAVGLPASVAQYEFNFGASGANNVVKTANTSATFTYDNAGTYNASLKAFDAQGTQITSLQNCFRTVTVLARPNATGTPTGANLPKTGPESFLFVLLAPLAGVGAYLYKKFKLL
jgi:PKD repeat protein